MSDADRPFWPMEIYDVRGHVGTLSFYAEYPQVPALTDQFVGENAGSPFLLSTNLVDHGWMPNGLEIAVRSYEPHFVKRANVLRVLGVLEETGEKVSITQPWGEVTWAVYRIAGPYLKPGVAEAWAEHLTQLEPEEAPAERDLSVENLKRLTDIYLVRYRTRLSWPNAVHSELKQLIHLWEGIAKVGYEWAKLTPGQKQEVVESVDDE